MEGRQQTPPSSSSSRPPGSSLPYREDCWSEGETSVLIEAWGDRYLDLNRGNLRQKQWQEVADAVNSRPCDPRRPPRTDVQCKNRIDTLKKKYKAEKSKIADGAISSQWIFFDRLDSLIGPSVPNKKMPLQLPPPATSPPLAVPLPASFRRGLPLATAYPVRPSEIIEKRPTAIVPAVPAAQNSFFPMSYAPTGEAIASDESDSSSSRSSKLNRKRRRLVMNNERSGKGLKREKEGGGEEEGIKELSKAIVKMAEIYEKVEVEKQRQMMELEKQRMEFTKSLEFQRMKMFVDSQVQMMKMKQAKRGNAKSNAGECLGL